MKLCRAISEDLCRKVVTNARVRLQEIVRQNGGHIEHVLHKGTIFQPMRINSLPDVKCFCNNKNVLRMTFRAPPCMIISRSLSHRMRNFVLDRPQMTI